MFKKFYLIGFVIFFHSCYDANQVVPDDKENSVSLSPLKTEFDVSGTNYKQFVFTNLDFTNTTKKYEQIENAVVLIHGLSYDAKEKYQTLYRAVKDIGLLENTLIISPLFKETEGELDELYFRSGYRIGNFAKNADISSFTILDDYIQKYIANSNIFPHLKRIVIMGHSAGGQFVHRYAPSNSMEDQFPDILFSYVVSNPSSYLYPRPERWNKQTEQWEIPSECSDYNTYHYGLEHLNNYMTNATELRIKNNFPNRNINYLLGELDQSSSDQKCGAMWQEGEGAPSATYSGNRYLRGQTMFNFFEHFYPENKHSLTSVANIGHDAYGIFTSPEGENLLLQLLNE